MINNKTLNQIIMDSVQHYSTTKKRNDVMSKDEQLMHVDPDEYKKQHQAALDNSRNVLDKVKQEMKERSTLMKLEILLLNYLFIEDDGKITRNEKRAITNHFSKYKNKVSSDAIKELKNLKDIVSLGDITTHIYQNSISISVIQDAIKSLYDITSNLDGYYQILKKIETTLLPNE